MDSIRKIPQLSVVIPLYNKEEQIKRAVDSVLMQEFSNFELIVINDGSTDKSAQIVAGIPDDRIRLINKPNGGVSSARNLGMSEAKGKYVILLDADDHFLPGAFDLMMDPHDADIVVGSFIQTDDAGNIDRTLNNRVTGLVADGYKAYWRREIFLRMGNMFIKSEIVRKQGGLRTDMCLYEDNEWLLRIIDSASILVSKKVIMDYNRGASGLSHVMGPIEKEYAYTASVKGVTSKYKRRIIGDFVFRRLVLRFIRRDWNGVKRIWSNNSWRFLYCLSCFILGYSRDIKYQYSKNSFCNERKHSETDEFPRDTEIIKK